MDDERTYVSEVTLEGFRGFAEKVTIPLHPNLVVFAGVNGSGKTSVLEALACHLSVLPSLLQAEDHGLVPLESSDVSHGVRGTVVYGKLAGALELNWGLFRALDADSSGVVFLDENRAAVVSRFLATALPAIQFIHSGSTRMPRRTPFEAKRPNLIAYRGCFDSEAHQFAELEEWFEQEENFENEQRIRKKNLSLTIPSLRAVRGAVESFLSHLHQSGLGNLKVIRFHSHDPLQPAKGQLAIDKNGHELMLTQLSDGERRLVLMVADIARRMAVLNPSLDETLRSPGIILIDEIELHLHPRWQRTVIGALQAAFPNVQFIIATHSPQVLASVPDECVVLLKDGKALPGHPRVRGRDTNTILEEVMEASARPPEIQARIDEIYELIERHPDDAHARLEELEAELGEDEPELVRARAMMDFVGA
ncbi:MAG: AAA family ATPase [Myxococcales bacterium]|nr:AAA family ATPase [Myxococcales bacterium]